MRLSRTTAIAFVLAALVVGTPGAAAQPRPNGSMPVLVITNPGYAANPFSAYMPEILRGEGLVEFEQTNWSVLAGAANPGLLFAQYDVIVTAEGVLDSSQQTLLRNYVQGGGTLVSNRPDAGLADVFGIGVAGTRPEQYLQYFGIDRATTAGAGFGATSLQYHGEATNYTLAGATALAHLYDGPNTPSSNPAVTIHEYGEGKAVALAFSLDKSIVLTRQGNPAWKDTEGDGIGQYRPMDMFMRLDGTKYNDPSRMNIPQADEAQRFLANVITTATDRPLPRMWYLPGTHKTLLVNTGDGESNYGAQFDPVFNDSASYGGAFTVYFREEGINGTTVAKEAAWRAAGHELGVHMWAGGAEGAGAYVALDAAYGSITQSLQAKFGHGSRTARNHTIDWTGWVDQARIEAEHGTGIDMNYYHYIASSALTTSCYFNGTGLPQRFIDENGDVIPIYQATTQWTDEWFADRGLSAQQTFDFMVGMFESAEQNGYYSAFVDNIHPVRYNGADSITPVWPHLIWEYCQQQGIPMWSGEMLLDFMLARDSSQFRNIDWTVNESLDVGILNFDFTTPVGGEDLTVMVPVQWGDRELLHLLADGVLVEPTFDVVKGVEYALFTTGETFLPIQVLYALPDLPGLPGDANRDGIVNDRDAAILAAHWAKVGAVWGEGDFSGDGLVDDLDASILGAHWLQTAESAAATPSPEPSTAALLLALLLTVACRRRLIACRDIF